MQELNFEEVVERIVKRDSRYTRDAYGLLKEALDFTQRKVQKKTPGKVRRISHVTGQELLEGVRQYSLREFGPMTITVLDEWGIRNCRDIGEIVFNMVENRLLAKTDTDSRDDFEPGYDFYEAFRKPFLPTVKLTPKPPIRSIKPKSSEPKV